MADETTTTFHQSEPKLCANGCGFFGTAATMNLCSKCYRDTRVKEEQAISDKNASNRLSKKKNQTILVEGTTTTDGGFNFEVPVEEPVEVTKPGIGIETVVVPKNRCMSCRKKVGVIGFKCRCGSLFCGTHRHPELHTCPLDYKASGREVIARANPEVKADKLQHRL